jgi:hypothetical protein
MCSGVKTTGLGAGPFPHSCRRALRLVAILGIAGRVLALGCRCGGIVAAGKVCVVRYHR